MAEIHTRLLAYALLMDGGFSQIDAAIMLVCFFVWLGVVIEHARRYAAAAQLVVHGGNGVAQTLGWSPFIVCAIVVATATSTPELATTMIARARGHHDVGLGNILGSNIINVFFIAAVAAMIEPYAVKAPEILPSLAFGIVTTLLILPGRFDHLGRWRSFTLLLAYAVLITITMRKTSD